MPRWLRVVRGMVGNGLTFAAGVGALTSLVGVAAMIWGKATLIDVLETAGQFAFASFLLGLLFSGVLIIVARSRQFRELTLVGVGSMGAGAGILYWLFLAMTGGRTWAPQIALRNFVLLFAIGTGASIATLLIARRASSALGAGEELEGLGAGDQEIVQSRSAAKVGLPRQ